MFIYQYERIIRPVSLRSEEGSRSLSCSDEVLNVGVAGVDTLLVGCSPVSVLDGLNEGEDVLEPEAAETHPDGVEVPSEDPGVGDKTSRFDELYELREYEDTIAVLIVKLIL